MSSAADPAGTALSADFEQRLAARFRDRPIYRFLEFELLLIELDRCVVAIDFHERFDNGGGTIHGGVLCMLADTAVACALSTNFDGRMGFATSNLNIHFLRRARGRIVADARIIKKGSTVCVGSVDMTDDAGALVASITCDFILTTSKLPPRSEGAVPP
ncbi:MAG TPA: PaaI family thioesterase [Thermoanaerobaculia bacterium]|nr:PaaI family thioesterase [Thermoanaerobaculia bacterium]